MAKLSAHGEEIIRLERHISPEADHDSGAGKLLNDELGEFIFLGHENFPRQRVG